MPIAGLEPPRVAPADIPATLGKLHRIDALCSGILRDSARKQHLDSGDALTTFAMIRAIVAGRI
jgi:hypothetical protein